MNELSRNMGCICYHQTCKWKVSQEVHQGHILFEKRKELIERKFKRSVKKVTFLLYCCWSFCAEKLNDSSQTVYRDSGKVQTSSRGFSHREGTKLRELLSAKRLILICGNLAWMEGGESHIPKSCLGNIWSWGVELGENRVSGKFRESREWTSPGYNTIESTIQSCSFPQGN